MVACLPVLTKFQSAGRIQRPPFFPPSERLLLLHLGQMLRYDYNPQSGKPLLCGTSHMRHTRVADPSSPWRLLRTVIGVFAFDPGGAEEAACAGNAFPWCRQLLCTKTSLLLICILLSYNVLNYNCNSESNQNWHENSVLLHNFGYLLSGLLMFTEPDPIQELVYDLRSQCDAIRVTKTVRPFSMVCCPVNENSAALIVSDGRVMIWELKSTISGRSLRTR